MAEDTPLVVIEGCDDQVEVVLTLDEYDSVKWFLERINEASGGGCQPRVSATYKGGYILEWEGED